MTQQHLDGVNVASRLVDHRHFGSAQRVDSVLRLAQPDSADLLVHQTGILPRADVAAMIHTAWKDVVAD